MKIVKSYINGQWREHGTTEYMDVVNSATRKSSPDPALVWQQFAHRFMSEFTRNIP